MEHESRKIIENLVKISFELNSEDWHGEYVETLWAEPIAGGSGSAYILRNTPYYVRGISFMDVVRVIKQDRLLRFLDVIEHAGHSTYRIISADRNSFKNLWCKLELLGCSYESTIQRTSEGNRDLYAVDVPKEADIYKVYQILEEGKARGVWIFEEGHCGHLVKD